MIVREIDTKNPLTKSDLPVSDYSLNPYVGCEHGCKYCYACFMKRFTNHEEPWANFWTSNSGSRSPTPNGIGGKRCS